MMETATYDGQILPQSHVEDGVMREVFSVILSVEDISAESRFVLGVGL